VLGRFRTPSREGHGDEPLSFGAMLDWSNIETPTQATRDLS